MSCLLHIYHPTSDCLLISWSWCKIDLLAEESDATAVETQSTPEVDLEFVYTSTNTTIVIVVVKSNRGR